MTLFARITTIVVVSVGSLVFSAQARAYLVSNWWLDGVNIVMDEVFLPSVTFSDPAQFQMSEWNEVDTTDNSHPFRINLSPQFSFGANDGDNTIGFLGEAGLNSQYGLSYANALAWAVTFTNIFSRIDECDIMLDPSLSWSLNPHNSRWFQSTVLHELGHCRGLSHYNGFLSMQNSSTSKYLRNKVLYMDDKVGVRQNASNVAERDITIYNKWHDGSLPQWMTMSPTTLREGDTIQLNNITVENRGTEAFGSSLRFGVYLSTNNIISTADQILNTGSFPSFGTFAFSTFNWSAQIPSVNDCTARYIGGIIDDNNVWGERFENNNAITFTNGLPFSGSNYTPTVLSILLAKDSLEPNDTLGAASTISLPFFNNSLSIDTDSENDHYIFTVTQPGILNVNVIFSHSLGDIDLYLLNSSGGIVRNSISTTNNETIVHDLAPGTYYVRVRGFSGGSCNRYSLGITFAPSHTLTASVNGDGTVTSSPVGITCPGDCTEDYSNGTLVTLTPTPATGSTFAGWSGCDSTNNDQCIVSMTSNRGVTATFNVIQIQPTLTVSKSGTGSGTVTSAPPGISCGGDCSQAYNNGTLVTLTPTPATGSTFANWSGCDSTNNDQCTVSMTSNRSVTATFNLIQIQRTLTVSRSGTGSGTVTSAPPGISCGGDCFQAYNNGTLVTLTPTPATGSTFANWSDCDSTNNDQCIVSMTLNRSVSASFGLLVSNNDGIKSLPWLQLLLGD